MMIPTGGEPYILADGLWETFQTNLNKFVNAEGGKARIVSPTKNRPDWDDVKDVLQQRKPISSLGCK